MKDFRCRKLPNIAVRLLKSTLQKVPTAYVAVYFLLCLCYIYFILFFFALFCFVCLFFFHNRHFFLFSDSVTLSIFLTHDALSSDHARNVVLVWILPHYARFLSHEPKKNITNPYPGEYQIMVGYIMDDFLVFIQDLKTLLHKFTKMILN